MESTKTTSAWLLITLLASLLVVACGDDEASPGWRIQEGGGDETTFGERNDVVVTADGDTFVVSREGNPDGCAQIGDNCVDIRDAEGRYCDEEGAQSDIILDENGDVIEVICYPPADDGTPVQELEPDADGNLELEQSENGAVLTFPEDTNGEVLEGDLRLSAERTTLYGNGVENTILGGNVTIESNNSRVRGLTIEGNVEFTSNSNNSKMTFCRVHGNLVVPSNGATVASCQVFGNVDVTGNDATLVNIGVQGEWNVNSTATCEGCYSFSDDDEDFVVADAERGDPLQCGPGAMGN